MKATVSEAIKDFFCQPRRHERQWSDGQATIQTQRRWEFFFGYIRFLAQRTTAVACNQPEDAQAHRRTDLAKIATHDAPRPQSQALPELVFVWATYPGHCRLRFCQAAVHDSIDTAWLEV